MHQIKIVHFGDSLTECTFLDKSKSWPNLCQKALRKKLSSITFEILNRGVCGDNSRQALERMQKDVQFEEPDIVTIQFGANDSDYWLSNRGVPMVSEGAFRANLIEMIARSKTFGIQYIIFQTNHFFLKDRIEVNEKTHNENLLNYNQIIREVAQEYQYDLVDIEQAFADSPPEVYTLPPPDGVHLNEFGCQLYAQALMPVLEKCIHCILDKKENNL